MMYHITRAAVLGAALAALGGCADSGLSLADLTTASIGKPQAAPTASPVEASAQTPVAKAPTAPGADTAGPTKKIEP